MAYLPGYCNITFANIVNQSLEWEDAETDDKNIALTYGRLFIDKNYTCSKDLWDTSDYTTIPDEVQRANAIIAELHIQNKLISIDQGNSGPITKKKVKAGSVESETTYLGYFSQSSRKIDQYPEITILLSPYCSLGVGGKNLIRV